MGSVNAGRSRELRVLLLIAPGEHTMYSLLNLPPFGPGVVTARLRDQGVAVSQYDLNSDFSRLYAAGSLNKAQLRPFYDERAIVGYVRGGHDDTLDSFADQLLGDKRIEEHDVVGISAGGDFSWLEMHSAMALGAYVKRNYGKTVVFGGNNLDYLAQFKDAFHSLWTAALENFRFVVTGPGEDVFLEILSNLDTPEQERASIRPGLAYLHNGVVQRPPDARHRVLAPDFDGLRLEDYANYIRADSGAEGNGRRPADERWNLMQLYKWPPYLSWAANRTNAELDGRGAVGKLVLPYVFNYNCPYSCAFCTESLERVKVVHAGVEQVVDDLAGLAEHYDTSFFYFFNNYFNLLNGFIEDFASEVVTRGIDLNWSDCARFNGLTWESLSLLRDSGCRKLTFGLETASGKMLEVIDKRVKLSEAERVLRWSKDVGIWADLEIITGLPHEDERNFEETCDFLERNAEYINFFNVNRYFVAPKSLMGANPGAYGMRLRKHPEAYQRLLDANYEWLVSGKDMSYKPQNFRVYEFDEIDGRRYEQIAEDTRKKIARLNGIQSNDFQDSWQVLSILRNSRTRAPTRLSNETLAFA